MVIYLPLNLCATVQDVCIWTNEQKGKNESIFLHNTLLDISKITTQMMYILLKHKQNLQPLTFINMIGYSVI